MTRKDIRVLAPAGSFAALSAALSAGADAVYFGLGALDMRSGTGTSFVPGDLREVRDRCSEAGAQAFLALNAIMYDADLPEMRRMVDHAGSASIDGVIAADPAVLAYAASVGLPVHLSTQANVGNSESLAFYARWADAVVLARELDLESIARIRDSIRDRDIRGPSGRPVEIEVFVHGALCMAISGACYLSLHTYGASANRGECLQSCRRSYLLKDAETETELLMDQGFFLSPKDLNTIGFLDRIVAAGATILKIEGRARSPEYAGVVVACYKEAADALFDGSYGPERIARWNDRLGQVFNRGFWEGHYLGKKSGEWTDSYGSQAQKKKRYLGTCVHYYARPGIAEIRLEAGNLKAGTELLIIGPTTGVVECRTSELRMDGVVHGEALKGQAFTMKTPALVRAGDKVYAWTSISDGPSAASPRTAPGPCP